MQINLNSPASTIPIFLLFSRTFFRIGFSRTLSVLRRRFPECIPKAFAKIERIIDTHLITGFRYIYIGSNQQFRRPLHTKQPHILIGRAADNTLQFTVKSSTSQSQCGSVSVQFELRISHISFNNGIYLIQKYFIPVGSTNQRLQVTRFRCKLPLQLLPLLDKLYYTSQEILHTERLGDIRISPNWMPFNWCSSEE